MRFMMLVKANKGSAAGVLPSQELVAALRKFNEEMAKAGVPLADDGLIEWRSRLHVGDGEVVAVRQVFEVSDLPPESLPPEDAARKQGWCEERQRMATRL